MSSLTTEEVFDLIKQEREYQNTKYKTVHNSPADYALIMIDELNEAIAGYFNCNTGRNSYSHEILQVAAVAIAYLEQYGCTDGVNVEYNQNSSLVQR